MKTGYAIFAVVPLALTLGTSTLAQDDAQAEAMSGLETLLACQAIESDADRLACFDSTSAALKSASQSGDLVVMSREEIDTVEKDAFGFNLPSLPRLRGLLGNGDTPADGEDSLDRVTYVVDRVERSRSGRYVFYLDNGQVWQQNESESLRRPRPDEDGVTRVEIRKASFGSFMLRVNGRGTSVRVRRVE